MVADLCQGADYLARNAATIGLMSAEIVGATTGARTNDVDYNPLLYKRPAPLKLFSCRVMRPKRVLSCSRSISKRERGRVARARAIQRIISGPITCEKHPILTRLCKHLKYLGEFECTSVRKSWHANIRIVKHPDV